MVKKRAKKTKDQAANVGFEAKMWLAAFLEVKHVCEVPASGH